MNSLFLNKKTKSTKASLFSRTLLFALAFFWAFGTWAYIPNSRMILSRAAKKHGKGFYVIQQDVKYSTGAEAFVTQEVWTIQDGDVMHLKVTGAANGIPVYFEYLYRNGRRYWLNEDQKRKSAVWTAEFFEAFFHYRSYKGLGRALVDRKIAPRKLMRYRPRVQKIKGPPKYIEEDYLRLTRTRGIVSYGFGIPTPHESTEANPGFWVEQDTFLMRRLRLPNSTEVFSDDYTRHRRGLWFPKTRTVTWDKYTAQINVRRVTSFSKSKKIKERLQVQNLGRDLKKQLLTIRFPEQPEISSFYSRLR